MTERPRTGADIPEFSIRVDEQGKVALVHAPQARAYLRRLRAKEGPELVAQFYPHREKRSERQNRAGHALFNEWLKSGETKKGWTLGALKLYALGQCFGYLELVHPVTGEVLLFPAEPHTSGLSMGQFCQLIEWILEHAAEEDGVVLMAPSEYLAAKEKQAKQAARAARQAA